MFILRDGILISYLGYETQIITLDIKDHKIVDVKMKKTPLELNEIQVTDKNIDSILQDEEDSDTYCSDDKFSFSINN